jgi:tryptophanyl-tRNA synthetase
MTLPVPESVAAPGLAVHPHRVFSGIQPTANIHLGNYLGAIKRFVPLHRQMQSLFCVVDLHAITVPQDPKLLAAQTREIAAAYIAAGIDPREAVIFVQSTVSAHAELGWIFNCVARMGWLERMTQFKDKAGTNAERVSVGLFDYPVLMSADILAYRATHVPVGEDQKQHLELSRDIADRFNRDFRRPGFFPLPEPLIEGPATRVMSLQDGTKKMSKSDPSDLSRIALTDGADQIVRKIKKARTDPLPMPETVLGLEGRPEVDNLVGIYAAMTEMTKEQVVAEYAGQGFGVFKPRLAEVAVEHLAPVTGEMARLLADPASLDRILEDGTERARALAAPVMADVREAVGLWGR